MGMIDALEIQEAICHRLDEMFKKHMAKKPANYQSEYSSDSERWHNRMVMLRDARQREYYLFNLLKDEL